MFDQLNFRTWFKYGLKAQKLLAQGIALGIMAVNNAPCKGKSFVNCLVLESFCPYRACFWVLSSTVFAAALRSASTRSIALLIWSL